MVFIVLSGFSLACSPARSDWRIGSLRHFAYRRAWRILPPYWAALAFSLLIAWFVARQPGEEAPTAKSVVVYGLLIQNVFEAPTPNGAFWSIAVEAQLYFVLPLMLLVLRRTGTIAMLAAVTVVVTTIGTLAPYVSLIDLLMRFTPQLAVLFAIGVAAAGVLRENARVRDLPWHWLSALAALPVVVAIVVLGSAWTIDHLFWVDLALGPSIGMMLAAIVTGRPASSVRVLDATPLRSLGGFSYSLYLTHAPLLAVLHQKLIAGRVPDGLPAFLSTVAIVVPASLLFARGFAALAETPFQRHRGWRALGAALYRHWQACRTARPWPVRRRAIPTGARPTATAATPTPSFDADGYLVGQRKPSDIENLTPRPLTTESATQQQRP